VEEGVKEGGTGDCWSCTVCAGVGACSRRVGEGKCVRVWWGQLKEKACFGRSRRSWGNIANVDVNTLRTGSFKLFKRPFPGFWQF